jgi:mRNA-degrading endonuclease RelE of RelBE toxin-antitoxin system
MNAQAQQHDLSYMVQVTRTAVKALKKLDKPLALALASAMAALGQRPKQAGERLSQPLIPLYSHHVTYKGKEFRLAYEVDDLAQTVIILLVGSHENFYRKLKQVFYS